MELVLLLFGSVNATFEMEPPLDDEAFNLANHPEAALMIILIGIGGHRSTLPIKVGPSRNADNTAWKFGDWTPGGHYGCGGLICSESGYVLIGIPDAHVV